MRYTVDLDPEVRQALTRLSPRPKQEVNRVLNRLANGPDRRVDIELLDNEKVWRAKAGRGWRVVFAVEPGHHIQVKRISRRRDAYEGMEHPHRRDVQEPVGSYMGDVASVPAAAAD